MINYNTILNMYPYNDLLFEIYHYIPKLLSPLLNKVSKRYQIIYDRIKRYVYHHKIYDNAYILVYIKDVKVVMLYSLGN
jgi:hypothetical protein